MGIFNNIDAENQVAGAALDIPQRSDEVGIPVGVPVGSLALDQSSIKPETENIFAPAEDSQAVKERQVEAFAAGFVRREKDERARKIAAGFITREDADPVKWRQAIETAKGLGYDEKSFDLIYDNLDEFGKQWKEQEVRKYVENCEAMQEMCLADTGFLNTLDEKTAKDMADINFNLAVYGQAEKPNAVAAFGQRVGYQIGRAEKSIQTGKLAGNVLGKRGEARQQAIAAWRAEYDKLMRLPEIDTKGFETEDFILATTDQLPIMARTTGAVVSGTLAGGAAGSVVPVVGSAAGAAAGFVSGNAVAAYQSYELETNSMLESLLEMKDKDGKALDDDIVDWTARAYGAVATAIEIIPMKTVTNVIPGMKNITRVGLKNAIKKAVKDKTKRQVIMGIIKDYGLAVATESAEEAAQQFAQAEFSRGAKALMNALYDTNFKQDKLIDDLAESGEAAIAAGKASVLLSGTGSALRVRPELRAQAKQAELLKSSQEVKAKFDAARLDEVAKAAQSYLQKPSADKANLKAYLQKAKRGSVYQDIYLSGDDAKAVMVSEAVQKNKAALQKNGLYESIERQIEQADELGTPVRIGFADFGAEIMASQELYGAFKDVIKTYENGITMAELKAEAERREKIRKDIAKAAQDNAADFEFAYRWMLEQLAAGGIDQQRRVPMAEAQAKFATYMAKNTNAPIQEFMANYAPQFDRSFDGSISGGENVQNIIQTIRKSAEDDEVQNLMKRAGELGKRDARKISKILSKHIDNAAVGDVRQFMRVANAIGDMKLNIEAMSDDDIIKSLRDYTASTDLKLNIKRDAADKVKSGIFSAGETALKEIQAKGGDGDYVLVGGGRIPVNYKIVELAEVITSHDDAGVVNAAYPQDLQPRDRSRSASDSQIAGIVNNFAPERVGKAEIATEGAPIVTEQGYVAVGNGRAMAIRQMYNNEATAQKYKDYLSSKGFDLTGFERPVLVRQLAVQLDNKQLKALVDDANTAGTMLYSDSENALRDAGRMSSNLFDLLDMEAEIDSAANRRFLNGFFAEVVPSAERNAYLDKDDKITRNGVERVENAIVAKLLPDTRFLSALLENPDNNIRKITKELAKAAPAIMAFENEIAAGRIGVEYSIAADVSGAVELLKRAKDRGVSAADFVAMRDMFEEPISSSTQNMVQLFENSTGAADFLNKIRSYIRQAAEQGDLEQGRMFEMAPVTKQEILESIARSDMYRQGKITDMGGKVELAINSQEEVKGLSNEDFKNKMLDTLKSFKGNKIFNQSLNGEIEIRTSSIKKYKSFFADKNKRLIVPYIPELLGKARFVKEESYARETEPNIKAYYKSDLPISIDRDVYLAHITVREDQYGNFFWDTQLKKESQHATPATNPGDTGPKTDKTVYDDSISLERKKVNKALYQLPAAQNERDLLVQHATTLEKLEAALELGAMPMPSLAVTKSEYAGDSNFGEIVFVGGSDIVDPARNKNNHTFPADIYSTRKISPTYEINKDGREYLERLTGAMSQKGLHYWVENVKQNLDTGNDASLKELFLASKSKITDLDGSTYRQTVNMSEQEKSDFAKWKRKFIAEYTNKMIFEGFTPSGGRKFSPYDLNNILRLMKKENLKASESTAGGNAHALRGVWAEELKSIEEIKKAKDRIVDTETYEKLDKAIWDETTKLSDLLVMEEKAAELESSWVASDEYIIEEVLKKLKPTSNIKAALGKAGLRSDKKAVDAVKRYMALLKATPVQYFESKPQRAVEFSEFAGVIMPTSQEYDTVANAMSEYGLRVLRSDDAGRAIAKFQDVFFQNNQNEAYGAYLPVERKIILYRNNNLSTLIHETGHWWLDTLGKLAVSEQATEKLLKDWQTVKEWLEVGTDNQITTEQHEKFARGVEKYFMTCKAPSAKLKKLFDTFLRWLTGVYRDVQELDVDLNDDIVRVFDHWLASEAEIEEYRQAAQFAELLEKSALKGLNKTDLDKYADLASQSLTMAKDKHLMDKVSLILKEETEEYQEKQAQLKAQVLEEWAIDRINKAVYILTTGENAHGKLDLKIKTEDLQRLLGKDFDKYTTFGGRPIFAEDGLSLEQVKNFTGLSEYEIKAALLTARARMNNFKKELQRRTHQELGNPVTYEDIEKQVVSAFWNEKRADLLDMDMRALSNNTSRPAVVVQGFKLWAQNKISSLAVKELKPDLYAKQMQIAGDKALQALNHENKDLAYREKIKQIRNFVLYQEAAAKLVEVESTLRRLKQIGKQETNPGVDQVYQDAVRALLSRFTLSRALSQKAKERLGNLSKWVLEQRSNGYDIALPDGLLEKNNGSSYAELTVDEFLTLGDSVKSLIANGRAIREYEIEGQLIERDKMLSDLAAQLNKTYKLRKIQKTGKKKFKGVSELLAPADAAILTIGDLSNRIDGYDTNGIFHKMFLQPMTESQNRENELLRLYGGKVKALRQALPETVKQQLFENVEGARKMLGADYTRAELIAIGLNMGNYSNLQRLKDGNGFNEQKLGWVARILSKEEWDFIQGVWDALDSLYPLLAEHHKKMSGLDMDHIVAAPVKTPYGVYRGGYFPLFYDRSADIEARQNNSLKQALLESDYGRATTSKGYTKNRREVVNEKIKFDLALVHRHLATAIHDLAYRGNIRQMWNLANHPDFISAMDSHMHESYRRQLLKLIKDLANTTNRAAREMTFAEKLAHNMRVSRTAIGLGFRVKTAVKQLTGFAQSIAIMKRYGHKKQGKHGGGYWLIKGVQSFAGDKTVREWCVACSGELQARLNNMDANISEAMKTVAQRQTKMQKINDNIYHAAFLAIGKMDIFTAESTWYGAYLQARQDFGYEHQQAVFYADRVMIESQGSGNLKDKPAMQRVSEWEKMLLMFYSPFSGMYGLWTSALRDIRDGNAKAAAMADLAIAMCLPAWLDAIVDGEQPDSDDDLAKWMEFLLLRPLAFWASTMPIARDLASYFEFGRAQGFFSDSFKALANIPKVFTNDKYTAGKRTNVLMNATAQLVGTAGGNLPLGGQVADWVQWLVDVAAGNVKIDSPIDIFWGLWRGKDGEPKRKRS